MLCPLCHISAKSGLSQYCLLSYVQCATTHASWESSNKHLVLLNRSLAAKHELLSKRCFLH